MKKVLFIANSDRHIKLCHLPYMEMFRKNGYIVHVLTNSNMKLPFCDQKIFIKLRRNPFSFINLFAVFKIRKIVRKNNYDIISCHTPIGGFFGRVSVIKNKVKAKVFYTAHGFHFYKGSKKISWMLYYRIEKWLSKYTNLLLTMNEEDYHLALDKFYCPVYKINGIGIIKSHLVVSNNHLKEDLGLQDKFIVTYIAEISKRKNQFKFLDVLKKYDLEKENIIILLMGDSIIKNHIQRISKYKNVMYVDFQDNVGDYLNMSDLVISPSLQEGLPLNIIEAMYFNKYIIATDIRGTRDLINKKNGELVPCSDLDKLVREIIKYKKLKKKKNIHNNVDKYLIDNVLLDVKKIYNRYLEDKLE